MPEKVPLLPITEPEAGEDQDRGLVNEVLAGNLNAFEELVRRHDRRVYRVTLAITQNKEDAGREARVLVGQPLLQLHRQVGAQGLNHGPRRARLRAPGLCPDAPEEEHERCDHCPLNRLDAAQLADTGQLLRRALDLRSALSMGLQIGMDEVDADEFFAMQVVEEERDAYDHEHVEQQ